MSALKYLSSAIIFGDLSHKNMKIRKAVFRNCASNRKILDEGVDSLPLFVAYVPEV